MKIRRAKIEDADQACAVIRKSITELCHLDHGGDEVHLSKWLSNKTIENVRRWIFETHFFVAEQKGQIVGVVAMTDLGKVTLNYVDPSVRFAGVSKALMSSIEENARRLGLAECVLESSQTALRFYQALGYSKTDHGYVLPLTGSPATVLSKRIGVDSQPRARIRRARLDEGRLLTELTMRSKAYWGYDAAFMADARPYLEFEPRKFLPSFQVYVIEEDGRVLGFCSLIPIGDETIELHDLFVEPSHIGKGYGKQLWDHAVNLARELGFRKLVLTADPNAELFYFRQGAIRTGEKISSVRSDRKLPIMEYRIDE